MKLLRKTIRSILQENAKEQQDLAKSIIDRDPQIMGQNIKRAESLGYIHNLVYTPSERKKIYDHSDYKVYYYNEESWAFKVDPQFREILKNASSASYSWDGASLEIDSYHLQEPDSEGLVEFVIIFSEAADIDPNNI